MDTDNVRSHLSHLIKLPIAVPWLDLICLFKLFVYPKLWSQCWHLYFMLSWIDLMWALRLLRHMKDLPQKLHLCVFVVWCVCFSWLFSAFFVLNAFSHWSHLTFLTFSWIAKECSCKYFWLKNSLSHNSHLRCLGTSSFSLWFCSIWSLSRWFVGNILLHFVHVWTIPLWTKSTWTFSWSWYANVLWHRLHSYLSPSCTAFWWIKSVVDFSNLMSQCLHLNFLFLLSWTEIWWYFSEPFVAKVLLQIRQSCFTSLCFIFTWKFKPAFELHDFSHWLQSYLTLMWQFLLCFFRLFLLSKVLEHKPHLNVLNSFIESFTSMLFNDSSISFSLSYISIFTSLLNAFTWSRSLWINKYFLSLKSMLHMSHENIFRASVWIFSACFSKQTMFEVTKSQFLHE